jgi:hypothetical protein
MKTIYAIFALVLVFGTAQAKDAGRKPSSGHSDQACRNAAADGAIEFANRHLEEENCELAAPVEPKESNAYLVKVSCHGIHAYLITTRMSGQNCKAVKLEREGEPPVEIQD